RPRSPASRKGQAVPLAAAVAACEGNALRDPRSETMESVSLVVSPTPLDEAPRLSAAAGVRVLVKRDDLTGFALGGNKARKLELPVGDALARGCDTLITAGGAQSNFARMTAAAAARFGLACHLVLAGQEPARPSGNLVLDRLFGATLHFAGSDDWGDL